MSERVFLNDVLQRLKLTILNADYKSAPGIAKEVMSLGESAVTASMEVIAKAIEELEDQLFGKFKVTVHPDFLMAVEAARLALNELLPAMPRRQKNSSGKVVLGVPLGDTHDLGAKIVAIALTTAGFSVEYLGHDVPVHRFVEKVNETGATIVALSSYQTTGFEKIREFLNLLKESGMANKVNVMIGGTVITDKYAEQMNVGYAKTASGAVKLAQKYAGGV